MDVFVMPSLWEGLPLSMILAMGAGMPVVATEVAGIPEIVVDGEAGWLGPAGNSLALATSLVYVFADRARAG
jgi:glycosyltransferase involved in cell wall biosynthesis